MEKTRDSAKTENLINVLCKKYFTPELFVEPITETESALKNKLYKALFEYAEKILNKKFNGKYYLDEYIPNTIAECWKNWEKKTPNSYSSYFFIALKNSFMKIIKNKNNEDLLSLEARSGDKADKRTFGESEGITDENNFMNIRKDEEDFSIKKTEQVLKMIDKFISISPSQARRGRKIMLTYRLLIVMQVDKPIWFYEQSKNHEFINLELVDDYYAKRNSSGKKEKYTQKDVAKLVGIEPESLSRINKHIEEFFKTIAQQPYIITKESSK